MKKRIDEEALQKKSNHYFILIFVTVKLFAITILFLFVLVEQGNTQPPALFANVWKMEKLTSVYKAKTNTLFHKDSASNVLKLATYKYTFFNNGTYTMLSDTSSNQGTWALNAKGDSAIIDTIAYKLIELSATHFTTRSYSIQLVDTAGNGTVDTVYNYSVLYPFSPLPVNLLSFSGSYAGSLVLLNWSTTQEQQNKEFQIQYSANGTSFETIGTVPGKGNSAIVTAYTFNTNRYQSGRNFYRLKQMDLDGHSALSPIVVINIDASKQSFISLSPNPASNKINLSISPLVGNNLQLELRTLAGQKVWNTAIAGNTTNTSVYLPMLTKGVYIVRIVNSTGEQIFYNKLVLE